MMDDDNNNNQRPPPLIKDIPPSVSAEDTTCASTVGTSSQVAHSNDNAMVRRRRRQRTPAAQNEERQMIRQQVQQLGVASTGALGLLVVSVIPLQILMGLLVVLALWSALLYRLLQMGRLEYQSALENRGLGRFLPDFIYNRLVNESFHEILADTDFFNEYRHFALYFIPGITAEQRDAYIEQLMPRHRRALQRPGIGNFLGPTFMRNIIGDQGLADQRYYNRRSRLSIEDVSSQEGLVPRRLELGPSEDAASQLGEDDDVNDVVSDLISEPPLGSSEDREITSRTFLTEPVVPVSPLGRIPEDEDFEDDDEEDEGEEDLEAEEAVVIDAAWAGFQTYAEWAVGLAASNVSRTVVRSTTSTLRRTLQATLGLGALSLGAGFLGIWAGLWSPQELRQELRQLQSHMPRQLPQQASTILYSSTIASGATATLFMMMGMGSDSTSPTTRKPREMKPPKKGS